MNDFTAPTQRVSAVPFPDAYDLPTRPDGASQHVQDAYRQTSFLLRDDLALFAEGMRLQLAIVRDSSHSSFRKHPYAALIGLWSRTYLALSDACLLASRGSYATCPAVVRSACEYVAAQHQLHTNEMPEFLMWLATNLQQHEAQKAFEVGLGRYFAGSVLAEDDRLRAIYRPASELGRPNFGATLLEVAPESNNLRLALMFGDSSFHLGWSELVIGWLLSLCERQLAVVVHAADVFAVHDDTHRAYAEFARRIDAALSRSDRCRAEEIEDGTDRRYLIHNFRRAPSGSGKRILL